MSRLAKIIAITGVLVSSVTCFSQNVTNRGKEFWVGYGHHQFMEDGSNTQDMVLYLSTEAQGATVTVTIDSSGAIPALWWRKTYTIPPYTVISTAIIPKGPVDAPTSADANYDARLYTDPPPAGTGGAGVFRKKGIHIQSDVPIVAYSHIYGSASSGATMLLPIEAWGHSYISVNSKQSYASNCYNWMYVVAQKDNTVVEITPSVLTRAQNLTGMAPGVPKTVTLMKGQIYQLIGANDGSDANGNGGGAATGKELTGTKVRSVANAIGECYPIAVFAGSSRTANPASCGSGGGDNDNQQLFPYAAWGKKYLTTPFSGGSAASPPFSTCTYKIAVKDPTTIVKKNGTTLTGLILGTYYTYESSTADYIEADKPIQVVQFMTGGGCLAPGGIGDPEMVVLSPIEQAIKRVGFYRNTVEAINVNYVTLSVPTAGVASLRIDNSAVFSYTYPHPNLPGYTVVIKRWSPAAQAQCLITCDSAFNAITYGLGSVESYAYNAGTYVNNLNAVSSIHNQLDPTVPSHPFTCTNTPVELSVLMAYQPTKMVWKLSALAAVLTPNADVTDNAPVPVGTVLVNGVPYYKYTLPGTYQFSTVGTYEVSIFSTHPSIDNCNNTEELKISFEVKDKPVPDFTFTHTGCTLDTVYFSGQNLAGGNFSLGQWNWTFLPSAVTASGQNVQEVLAPGTYNIKLTGISTEGCVGDITKPITIYAKPTATLDANPLAMCLGQPVTLSETSSYAGTTPGISSWYWNLDNGTILNNANGNNVVYTYPAAGTYNIKHVVKISNLCISDTAVKTIVVNPEARIAFTYPPGCLPPTGIAQFTAAATDLGGVPITSYSWNFGDPNANAGNPNTSTAQNPSHTYTVFGTYPVTLTVTTNTGCNGDSTINLTFSTQPALAYAPMPGVCENAGVVSVANATVTNATTGTGVYSGPGTTAAGMFDPAAAGPGTHTITYTFTSTGGCVETVTQTITVYAKPHPVFSYPNGGCLAANGQVLFTNNSTIADAQTMTWLWNFNDPNANAGNPNTSTALNPTHNFGEGTYAINLTATSSNGCIKDTTITAVFSVTPTLAYPALTAVCENAAAISVATASVTNTVTGTGAYSGPGTTSAGIFDPAVAGAGTHTITYSFTTAGGCTATTTQTILVHAKPHPAFIYTNNGCLPSSGLVQFTNGSTIADAQTMIWTWTFNDPNANAGNPNTSVAQNPTHNYGEGTFPVNLLVTSSSGCVKDTTINAVFKVTPSLAYPALTSICENATAVSVATASVLNGVTGTGVYSGPGTSTTGSFNPSVAGPGTQVITYTFTSTGGCTQSTTQNILVYAKPKANFGFPAGGCLPANGLVTFNNTSTIADAQTMTWLWNFNDPNANAGNPNTSTAQNPSHIFAEGTYAIQLTTTSSGGCVKDTTINAVFNLTPTLAYPALTAICENAAPVSVATASATNAVTGSGVYSGPGTTAAGIFNPAIAGPGTHTITYTYTTTGGCTQSITQTILVYAKPHPNFTFPTGTCLPANGQVAFTNTTTIADAQTMTWLWNFNDPNANAGNPNTSTAPNPTHNYAEGTYNINLAVTSSNGCVKDTTINAVFKVTPVLAYPALTAICENAAPVSVASASATNGVTGTGTYSGAGTTAAGIFNPATAGAGTHIITYTFTTAGGCTQSITQNILVYAKPHPNFSFPTGTCLAANGQLAFTNTSTIADAQTMTWLWNFNDPNANAGNPNTSTAPNPTHNYTEGTYNVNLAATSSNGCVKDTTIVVIVKVTPALAYAPLTGVCESAAPLSVATASVTNGVTGTGTYSGPGTTGAGMFDPAAAGAGIHTITYSFTSTGGCIQTITRTIEVYPRPLASFTATADVCLNQMATISSTSTIPAGTITTWNWNLGNGNTPTNINGNPFTVLYTPANTYTITLTNISNQGCTSLPASHTVVVHPLPSVDFNLPADICMPGGIAVFANLTSVADNSALTYQWSFGDASPVSNATNPSHVYAAIGNYNVTLTATSAFGCSNQKTKQVVDFYDKPIAQFTVTPDELCQGASTVFADGSTAPNSTLQSWQWSFGDNTSSTSPNPTKTFTAPGIFTVQLKVTNAVGCVSDPFTKTVTVHLQPVIDAGQSFVVPQGSTVQFTATANSPGLIFNWSPPTGLSNPSALSPKLVATADQVYTLTATGDFGCTATDFITIKILKPVSVPNVFTPNGDNIHDKWMIPNIADYPDCTVEVFNRYGQQVFYSVGYNKPWDGTFKGKDVPIGTYYYVIELKSGFKPVTGSVTVVR